MICDACGKDGARIRHLSRSYGQGNDLMVIENVPVVRCPHCGESYLTAATIREIERIRSRTGGGVEKREVAVAGFPKAS